MNVIIFGTNDCAALASFYFSKDTEHTVVGFCVDEDFLPEDRMFHGKSVKTLEEWSNDPDHNPIRTYFFCPLYDNKLRERKYNEIKKAGYDFVSYVSSKATVWSPVGENCFVMEDNTIQPFVSIGNNVIMWSGNHIGHHSDIADNVFISSHVVISGHCEVKKYCWLGVNSTLRDHIVLEEGTFVAMATSVHKNTKPYKMYFGNPAKAIKDVE